MHSFRVNSAEANTVNGAGTMGPQAGIVCRRGIALACVKYYQCRKPQPAVGCGYTPPRVVGLSGVLSLVIPGYDSQPVTPQRPPALARREGRAQPRQGRQSIGSQRLAPCAQ